MTTKTDASEQVKFLVSCISNTQNGRPDFTAVAQDLGIVTKAAAQKRYERLLKQHNVKRPNGNGNGASANNTTDADSEATPKKAAPKKAAPKKPVNPRKRAAPADDTDEGGSARAVKKPRGGRAMKKEELEDVKTLIPPASHAMPVKPEEQEDTSSFSSAPVHSVKSENDGGDESALSGEENTLPSPFSHHNNTQDEWANWLPFG